MSKVVDARGLACPQPVILTRAALQDADCVSVIVDNDTARQNVTRMAEKAGCTVQTERRADGIYLTIRRGAPAIEPRPAAAAPEAASGPLVLVISSDVMGRGDDELGSILIRGFFHSLGQTTPQPSTIIFFNSGVKLVAADSPVLEDLQALAGHGIELLVCGTCLGHYNLKDKVAVGEISNMYTITETLMRAGKVVNL